VLPKLEQLETKDWVLAREMVKVGASLGLLGVDVPEAAAASASTKSPRSWSAKSWRARRLSARPSARMPDDRPAGAVRQRGAETEAPAEAAVGRDHRAYGLSETGSGSDALGARTKAARQADGSFLLNGEKMWITNGGFADLFVIFCKVDGDQFTALLVERGWGVKSGKEEHKDGPPRLVDDVLIFRT
jgi:alkylation response protein AidB-like acyl-CoA dehydrogenase